MYMLFFWCLCLVSFRFVFRFGAGYVFILFQNYFRWSPVKIYLNYSYGLLFSCFWDAQPFL
jgi:hypothetical protein